MGSTTSYSLSYRNTIPLQMAAKALLGQMVETTVLMIPKIDNNVSMASTVTPFYKIKKKQLHKCLLNYLKVFLHYENLFFSNEFTQIYMYLRFEYLSYIK